MQCPPIAEAGRFATPAAPHPHVGSAIRRGHQDISARLSFSDAIELAAKNLILLGHRERLQLCGKRHNMLCTTCLVRHACVMLKPLNVE